MRILVIEDDPLVAEVVVTEMAVVHSDRLPEVKLPPSSARSALSSLATMSFRSAMTSTSATPAPISSS